MTSLKKGKRAPNCVQLSYQLLRNTTSPDEKSLGVQSFVANIPAFEILKVETKANLRSYLGEYDPRKRNRVHDAIRRTIDTQPERFIVRNSGIVITATDVDVNDSAKLVTLVDANVINGAQSRGEIGKYLQDITDPDSPNEVIENPFHVRVTIIVDPDPTEIIETAIARNIVTPIKSVTEANARGQLNELAASIGKAMPSEKIKLTESDVEGIDVRKILQLSRLLMPNSVSGNSAAVEKLRAYKNAAQCLTDFCDWSVSSDPNEGQKYHFTVQIAPQALKEYEYWETHPEWNKQYIWTETKKGGRAVRRDRKTKKITWISPAILFPIMGAMSEFVVKDVKGKWHIQKPKQFKPQEMIRRAANQFRAHDSNPILMGRNEAVYDALRIYPQTIVDVLQDVAAAE